VLIRQQEAPMQSYSADSKSTSASPTFFNTVQVSTPPVVIPQKVLMEDVLEIAKKTFKPGIAIRKELNAKYEIDPSLEVKDEFFQKYDAHRITGTHFIAGEGPSESEMANFIKHTAFNEKISIQRIIAIGDCLSTSAMDYQDFFDYCSGDVKGEAEYKFDSYSLKIKRESGNVIKALASSQIMPRGIVQSTLSITDEKNAESGNKVLKVTIIPIEDMRSLNLDTTNDLHAAEKRKEILWDLFQASKNENIFIHCQAGLGRTGHLILTFAILQEYDEIFANKQPELIAKKIHEVLNRIREKRPALVFNQDQFTTAIRNAKTLHEFGMRKILEASKVVDVTVPMQKPSK
jgi:protein tyrosine phosphatase